MDVYAHEKEQIENIKSWWRENRWYIVAGLLISAAIVGGWRYWLAYQQEQAEAASLLYDRLITRAATEDAAAIAGAVTELQQDYAGTPYAALATLKLAAEQVDEGDFAAAATSLRWALDNTDDDELALVARARLARVQLELGQHAAALELLNAVESGKFAALYAELRGDALLAGGDRNGARAAYEAALAALEPGLGDRRLLQMKLENVAMPLDALTAAAGEQAPVEAAANEPAEPVVEESEE